MMPYARKTGLIYALLALILITSCRTAPTVLIDGSGQFDSGDSSLGAGKGYIDSASGTGKELAGEIDAAGEREKDRTAELAGEVGKLGEGFTTIQELVGQCEVLIRESQDELQRYLDAAQGHDGGSGPVP